MTVGKQLSTEFGLTDISYGYMYKFCFYSSQMVRDLGKSFIGNSNKRRLGESMAENFTGILACDLF